MPEVKADIDRALAPGHPQAKRKWLVGVGVGGPKHETRADFPSPAGDIIGKAFAKSGLVF